MFESLIKQICEIEKKIEFDIKNEANYKRLINSYPVLDYATERKLFESYNKNGDTEIRDVIFKCHMRDVYDCLIKSNKYNEDLISEGNVLLLQTINKFDYTFPYITFKEYLNVRLVVLFNEMGSKEDAFHKTKMNIQDLARLESKGKINLDNKEEKDDKTKNDNVINRERLIIVKNKPEPLIIVKKIKNNYYPGKTGNDLIDY